MDAPCLDCGESIVVEMQDEAVLSAQPESIVGYAYSQIGGLRENLPWR